jgi:hypothetical protein
VVKFITWTSLTHIVFGHFSHKFLWNCFCDVLFFFFHHIQCWTIKLLDRVQKIKRVKRELPVLQGWALWPLLLTVVFTLNTDHRNMFLKWQKRCVVGITNVPNSVACYDWWLWKFDIWQLALLTSFLLFSNL